jgi:hypothetical protein
VFEKELLHRSDVKELLQELRAKTELIASPIMVGFYLRKPSSSDISQHLSQMESIIASLRRQLYLIEGDRK